MNLFILKAIYLVSVIIFLSNGKKLPLIDPLSCYNMCRQQSECPQNAACIPVTVNSSCGICVCGLGFKPVEGKCIQNIVGSDDKLITSTDNTDSTEEHTTETTTEEVTTVGPVHWDCTKYKNCEKEFPPTDERNPFIVRTSKLKPNCSATEALFLKPKKCTNLVGGNECAGGGQCLKVNKRTTYCICQYSRAGKSCHMEKRLKNCKKTTGNLPNEVYHGKRFRHIGKPDTGSIYARHFVPSMEHCVRLCEWVGPSRCRSLNYGEINGRKVCELLTIWANKGGPLHSYLINEHKWTYACCFKRKRRRANRKRSRTP